MYNSLTPGPPTGGGGNWGILPWAPRRSMYSNRTVNYTIKAVITSWEGPHFYILPWPLKFSWQPCLTHMNWKTLHTCMGQINNSSVLADCEIAQLQQTTEILQQSYITQILYKLLHAVLHLMCGIFGVQYI